MSLITIQPDSERIFAHGKFRFWVDEDMPNDRILQHLTQDVGVVPNVPQLIEKLEKTKGWKIQERVPPKKKDVLVCCDQMKQAPGTELRIVFEESPLQQSSDDMNDPDKVANPNTRRFVEGKKDIIVHLHFIQPAVVLGVDRMDNIVFGSEDGFVPAGELPGPLRDDLFGADGKKTQSGLIVPKWTRGN